MSKLSTQIPIDNLDGSSNNIDDHNKKYNENRINIIIERAGSLKGISKENFDFFKEELEATVETNAKNWKSWRENYSNAMQVAHDRAKGYTYLISIAGYAGFFWLWERVSSIMSPFYYTATGLCLTFSLAIFVFSEVFTMVITGLGEIAESEIPDEPRLLNDEILLFGKERERFNRIHSLAWKWHFFPAAIIGVIGVVIVLVFWVHGLINGGFTPPIPK